MSNFKVEHHLNTLTPDHAGKLDDVVVTHWPLVTPPMVACHDPFWLVKKEHRTHEDKIGKWQSR